MSGRRSLIGRAPLLRQPDVIGLGGITVHSITDGATVRVEPGTSGDVIEVDLDVDHALNAAATLVLSAMTANARRGVDPEATITSFLQKVEAQASAAERKGRG